MPVKLGSKLLPESAEARIEIVPLIDIMFFLLASFMLVSLSMVNLKSVKVNLPTATTATPEARKDFLDVSVDKSGGAFLDKKPMAPNELRNALIAAHNGNPNVRVFISADQDARHGAVMAALDAVRSAGIDKVGFEIAPAAASKERP
ncbi:MAG TPA: biopolymer transporter ExbD [Phycisphaerae bacterium]|nr:biopolymer transporter ExbD [Phycisphaerae bacterium]